MKRRLVPPLVIAGMFAACTGLAESPPPIPPTIAAASTVALRATTTAIRTPPPFASPTPTPLPPVSVPFYRLRIEYSTTSNWTSLSLDTMEGFLTARIIAVQGDPAMAEASPSEAGHLTLHLNRAEDAMFLEQPWSIGMTVDIALAPHSMDRALRFHQEKGAWFQSTVRIFLVDQGRQLLLAEFRQTDEFARFSVDLSAASELSPSNVLLQSPAPPRMLWAIYYPWTAWDQSADCTDHPLLKYQYNSDETLSSETLEEQIHEAKTAGIDGFLVSWFDDPVSRSNLARLLEAAEPLDFRIAIYLETLLDGTLNPAIESWLAHAIDQFGNYPSYMQVNSKPVIVVFSSQIATRDDWGEIFRNLARHGHEASYIAMSYDLADLDLFDGLHQYIPVFDVSQLPDLAARYVALAQGVRNYPLLEESPRQRIFAATVQPGFNACPYHQEVNFIIERQEGAFFQSIFEAAVRSDPDWIIITTWNEFGENTHIEPSKRYGDLYLRLTREFADTWRGTPPRHN